MSARLHSLFRQRRAGVLLHPSSLPSGRGFGDLGQEAYNFVRWLEDGGFRVWQMLPIGPTHGDGSPYQGLSVHAGNPELIDLEGLARQPWLEGAELPADRDDRGAFLAAASAHLAALVAVNDGLEVARRYRAFCRENLHWLEEFALFMALREHQQQRAWLDWPPAFRMRRPDALAEARRRFRLRIEGVRFEQFVFSEQWRSLRAFAHRHGIVLFGDMPIFVHLDSADVWARQSLFQLDSSGRPTAVSGVPPDYFSATGQRWGNPLYHWERMAEEGFAWWIERVRSQQRLFDLIRVDHFRGFESYWEIPAEVELATEGRWIEAPGAALFDAIARACGEVPFVAENLGLITAEVEALRASYALPGMLVMQFAFDGNAHNPYLPYNHRPLEVAYTGTHDNDTTVGWFESMPQPDRQAVLDYLGYPGEAMPWPLIRAVLASVAGIAILPMQDLLCLGSEHRMNIPGTTEGNWSWRFGWDTVPDDLHLRMRHLLGLYGRLTGD